MAPETICRLCGCCDDDITALTKSALEQVSHPPALHEYLSSNDVPGSTAQSEIQNLLSGDTQDLAEINVRITQLQKELDELFRRRTQKEKRINDCKVMLHPLRRVSESDDILFEIFLNFINEDLDTNEEKSSIDPCGMVWILPRVSKRWRTAALSLTRLWSTIRIAPKTFKLKLGSRALCNASFMLGIQLRRSGLHPLSVSIDSSVTIPPESPLLQVLFPTSDRWRDFCVRLPLHSFASLTPWVTSFPILTTVHIWVADPSGRKLRELQESGLAKMFQHCPCLHTVYVEPGFIRFFTLPLSQIQSIHATRGCLDLAVPRNDLASLPNLCSYYLKHLDRDPSVNDDLLNVQVLHLERLILISDKPSPMPLLKFLQAPSLKIVNLDNISDVGHLLYFLHTFKCQLIQLELRSQSLSDIDCFQILEAIPSLESLTLNCPLVYTDTFVKKLTSIETPMLVPNLKFLELKGYPECEAAEMVKLKEVRPQLGFIGGGFAMR